MHGVCKGERRAFELLYDRYFDKLVWYARRFVEEQKAEDIVQDIFIKIIETPEQFDGSRKFSTWVYTVTGNRCKNVLRDEENRNRILMENGSPDEIEPVINQTIDYKLLKQRIYSLFEELNEKEKNIYVLRFEHEMSIKEIAQIINIPEGSVKSGIYYLLKKVAPYLKEFSYEK
jgi:RNA polymerase sigma-70 factor (ECF subfamily)